MPSFSFQQIHDIGGWAFAAIVLGGMLYGMVKGLVVPRFLYDEQKMRADRAIAGTEATFATVDRLARAIDMLTTAVIQTRPGERHE